MWAAQILLAIIGLSAGVAVAGGLFSFVIGLGVVSDFADRTHTGEHILLYEDSVALGGILGNTFFIYQISIPHGGWLVPIFLICSGGIFVGRIHGAGRDIESVPDLYPQDQASSLHSLYYIGNGAGKRNRSIHILLQPVVGIK